jgi:glutamyl-tRNA synthetase
MRRGMTIEALREFILSLGASTNDNLMSWDKIWAMNKKCIDPVAHRYTGIGVSGANCQLKLTNFTGPETKTVQLHPKDKSIGTKTMHCGPVLLLEQQDADELAEGEEVTLMKWGNCVVTKITRDGNGKVTGMEGKLHLQGNFKTTKHKLTWVAEKAPMVPITAVEFDQLITKAKLEDGDKLQDFLTPQTRFETKLLGEPGLANVKKDQLIQLERRGYFRCDVPLGGKNKQGEVSKSVVLFQIPTGKAKKFSNLKTKVTLKQ